MPEELANVQQAGDIGSGAATPVSEPVFGETGSVGQVEVPASDFVSIRDHVGTLGLGEVAAKYQDDESFVNFLVDQYKSSQQAQQFIPYAQRYLQNATAFEQYLSQQQAQRPAQPEKSKFWSPPEFNPSWRQLVNRDDQGNLTGPPELVAKVGAYDQYRRDFVERLTTDPEQALTPLIQQVAEQVANGMLNQSLGGFQERYAARDFINSNSQWLYQSDNGNLKKDHLGNPLLTSEGSRFRDYVLEAEQMGIGNVAGQQRYAMRILQAERQGGHGTNAAQQNQNLKDQFLHRPNPAGAVNLNTPTGQPQAPDQGLSLAERLRRNMAAAGINDEALANDSR